MPADAPVRIATRDGVKTVTRDGDRLTADIGVARILGETKVSVRRTGRGRRCTSTSATRTPWCWSTTWPRRVAWHDEPAYDTDLYPEGVNVEFVVRRGADHVAMRVHERGSGETRSCGTGACAAAVAVAGEGPGRWRVDVPGG